MTFRPTGGLPGWASGPSGAAAITEPLASEKNLGWQVNQAPPAQYFNWLFALNYGWFTYFDRSIGVAHLGDASDGDLVLGPTTYQLSRYMQFGDVAVGPSSILDLNGWPLIARRTLTGVSGTIRSNGQPGGSGTASGLGPMGKGASGPLCGSYGGGTGPLGATGVGSSVSNALGGRGGSGGSGIDFAGFAGGSAVLPSGFYSVPPATTEGIVRWLTPVGVTHAVLRGGAGGGCGGAGPGGFGGGGGGGGGVALVAVQEINWIGTVEAKGGAGGMGWTGAAGGGGGGAGGAAMFAYGRRTQLSVRVDVGGGAGGTAGFATGSLGTTGGFGVTGLIERPFAVD